MTPLKTYLPGYLKDSERAATEQQHQRLDSLLHVYEINQVYLSGLLNAFQPEPSTPPSYASDTDNRKYVTDTILSSSKEELEFIEEIRERNKYNIAVSTMIDSENLMFENINPLAIISEDSKNDYKATVLLPKGASVCTVAEGKIISISSSPNTSGHYEIIIQHPKGFLSKTSNLSMPYVQAGESVIRGQILALPASKNGIQGDRVNFELWHDGNKLIPSRYLNGGLTK